MTRLTVVFLLVVFAATIWSVVYANDAETKDNHNPSAAPVPSRRSTLASVDCYSCVSCQNVTDKTFTQTCPYNADVAKLKKCVKYEERYPELVNGKNISWVIRGCVSDKGSCEDIRKGYSLNPRIDLAYCTECEGDRCNGGSRSLSDVLFAFVTVIFVPFFCKYVLS